MKTASIQEIKNELNHQSPAKVAELCLRLARFKKENKELLTFLLFEEQDMQAYIQAVKNEIDYQFALINNSHNYFVKKSLRKIMRSINKYIRYSRSKIMKTELLIHFSKCILTMPKDIVIAEAIQEYFESNLCKIHDSLSVLHEDLQYDYLLEINELKLPVSPRLIKLPINN